MYLDLSQFRSESQTACCSSCAQHQGVHGLGFVQTAAAAPDWDSSWLWWLAAGAVGVMSWNYYQDTIKPAYKRVARRRRLYAKIDEEKRQLDLLRAKIGGLR